MIPNMMKTIIARKPHGLKVLQVVELGAPRLAPGVTAVLGPEVFGGVVTQGTGVDQSTMAGAVMALVNDGGYAQYSLTRTELCFLVPACLPLAHAAGMPEVAFTIWNNTAGGEWWPRNLRVLVSGGRHISLSFIQGRQQLSSICNR